MRALKSYFNKPECEPTHLVQARLPRRLVKELKPFMKEKNLNWTSLIKGALTGLAQELKRKV